jgi:hypothetical protein
MKISKTVLWLSGIAALLTLLASIAGIVLKNTYAKETPSWAIQGIGQDIVNLVTVVVLVIAAYFARKGSFKAVMVWSGALLYLLYAYVIYAFDIHHNSLFLIYVAILGLSTYALVINSIKLRLDQQQIAGPTHTIIRVVSVFLLVIGIVFYLLWLGDEVPALLTGKLPQSLIDANLPSNPVHVLDLGLYLPALIITAVALWKRKPLGYLLAGPLLVFLVLMGAAILAIFLVTAYLGQPTSIAIDIIFTVIILISLVLSVLFLRELK